jgi:hypothetical protein
MAHPEHQLILQHVHVMPAAHGDLGWQEVSGAMPPCPGEAAHTITLAEH